MSERYQSGDNIHIESLFLKNNLNPVTNGSGIILIRRTSDDMYFNGSGWQTTRVSNPMEETDLTEAPGWWQYDFDTSNLSSNDEIIFEVCDENNKSQNVPQLNSSLIGGFIDFIDIPVSSIPSGTWNYTDRTLTGDFELGDGSVIIDEDFGGTDNLRVLNSATSQPIDNVLITVFLKSDFDAGNTGDAFIISQARTTVDGRWQAPLNLDPATYTLLYSKQGIFFNLTRDIIVT